MAEFLCFGSLNIDTTYRVAHFVRPGETLAASEVQTFCGGKGLNQSIALAKAGAKVYHAGRIGTDGAFLLEALEAANVDTQFVTVSPHEKTGHAVIQNTPDGENCILLFGGANRCVTKAQIDRVLDRFASGDMLVLQNEINEIPYLIRAAKKRGLRVAFTPAPMNEEVPRYPLEETDYILLNETEAAALADAGCGNEPDADKLAAGLCEKYPEVRFVLTLGAAGALYLHRGARIFQPAFPVKAVDTTAAGDTFAGFFLQSVAAGEETRRALETAAKAAAICVTRSGAASAVPTREELEQMRF